MGVCEAKSGVGVRFTKDVWNARCIAEDGNALGLLQHRSGWGGWFGKGEFSQTIPERDNEEQNKQYKGPTSACLGAHGFLAGGWEVLDGAV